jgi:hypothetical protein
LGVWILRKTNVQPQINLINRDFANEFQNNQNGNNNFGNDDDDEFARFRGQGHRIG